MSLLKFRWLVFACAQLRINVYIILRAKPPAVASIRLADEGSLTRHTATSSEAFPHPHLMSWRRPFGKGTKGQAGAFLPPSRGEREKDMKAATWLEKFFGWTQGSRRRSPTGRPRRI